MKTNKDTLRQVMRMAWRFYSELEGDKQAKLSLALKKAWAFYKRGVKQITYNLDLMGYTHPYYDNNEISSKILLRGFSMMDNSTSIEIGTNFLCDDLGEYGVMRDLCDIKYDNLSFDGLHVKYYIYERLHVELRKNRVGKTVIKIKNNNLCYTDNAHGYIDNLTYLQRFYTGKKRRLNMFEYEIICNELWSIEEVLYSLYKKCVIVDNLEEVEKIMGVKKWTPKNS